MKMKTAKFFQSGRNRRVSLALIFTIAVVAAFHVSSAYAFTGSGQMVYNNNTTTPQARTYTVSSNTFAAAAATVAGATPSWVKVVAGNARNEAVAGVLGTDNTLRILYWNGTAWSAAAPHNWTAALGASGANGRGFDIALEKNSGDIIVAYTTNAAGTEINYRVWNGSTWSAAAGYDSARLTGTVRFIKMASRPNSDEIALIMADTNNDLSAAIWSGTAWGNAPGAVLTNDLAFITAGIVDTQSFDLAYESLSGDLLVAYATDAEITGLAYNTYSGGAWSAQTRYANMNEAFEQVDCASDPLTDNVICAAVGTATQDMRVGVWSGTAWQGTNADVDASAAPLTFVAGRKYLATGWLNAGTASKGIITYNDNSANAINWVVVGSNGSFTAQTDNTAATPMPVGGIAYSDIIVNPIDKDSLLYIFQDTTNFDIFAKRLIMDTAGAFTWSDANGGAVINAAPLTASSESFHIAYDLRDNTPPTTSGLVIDSPVYNTFVGSPFTFHGTLTDTASGVTSCEVCVKNGAECTSTDTWVAGTLSGSGPYTCTAAGVTTYSNGGAIASGNNVYVDVRGTSTGGRNDNGGTAVFKTMDKTAPTDGTLTVTPGIDQNSLSWTAASDANSGLRIANTYVVRSLPGTTPPTCSTGTAVYSGTGLSYVHANLTPATGGYSYRVCAYDNVDMVSAGAAGTGLPTWGSTVTCGRCHGDNTSFPDGTGRNVPAGTFVGDHEAHAVNLQTACSVCHVTPASNAHRNGTIEMQAIISGGSYSRVSPISQGNPLTPATGTCSTISCHGANNPTPQWGVGTVGCVDCHAGIITRTKAAGTLDNVITEFGQAWGHKKSGRGAVTDADCIVCHLEGNYASQKTSAKHMDGNIDLRDPDGAGETPITDTSGGVFTFTKFATSATRTATGHTTTSVDNVLTQKFCLACHDSDASAGAGKGGASNPTARTPGGTQYMPFGGVNLGATYTTANGAAVAGGLVDVNGQVATANSSRHPVKGPLFKDFATPAHFAAPYNNFTRNGTGGLANRSNGVVIYCFDCHNTATPLTTRTVVAHGNAVTVRGVAVITGTPVAGTNEQTLCTACHINNWTSGNNSHGAGSAFSGSTGRTEKDPYLQWGCNICHANAYTASPARPIRAQNVHGTNTLQSNGVALRAGGRWATYGTPVAFIRNREYINDHAPLSKTGETFATTGTCMGTTGAPNPCGDQGNQSYTVGGSY